MALLLYIFRRSFGVTGITHCGILLFYFLVDYVESSSPSIGGGLLGGYPFSRLLGASLQILPASVTVGACLSIGSFKLRGEWEAMQVAGFSPLRLFGAVGSVAVVAALLSLCFGLVGAPGCTSAVGYHTAGDELPSDAPRARWLKKGASLVRCSGGKPVEWVQRDGAGSLQNIALSPEEIVRAGRDLKGICAMEGPLLTETLDISGMQLSYAALDGAIQTRRRMGLSVRPLLVERALRLALMLACFIAPYLAFWAIFRSNPTALSTHAWAGLAATFTVTLAIIVPYQLALGGVISEWWIVGMPIVPAMVTTRQAR